MIVFWIIAGFVIIKFLEGVIQGIRDGIHENREQK